MQGYRLPAIADQLKPFFAKISVLTNVLRTWAWVFDRSNGIFFQPLASCCPAKLFQARMKIFAGDCMPFVCECGLCVLACVGCVCVCVCGACAKGSEIAFHRQPNSNFTEKNPFDEQRFWGEDCPIFLKKKFVPIVSNVCFLVHSIF